MDPTSEPRSQPAFRTAPPPDRSSVVKLNVGGEIYTTTVGTLIRIPDSRLAKMFFTLATASTDTDEEGRLFIDRSSTYFGAILDYLRSGQLPTQHIREVYREAQFFEIWPLVKQLEDMPQIFSEQVARKQFLLQVPNYRENLELMVRLARAEAMAARHSHVLVCAVRTEEDAAHCADSLRALEADKRLVVKFGPWKAPPVIRDLLDSVRMDIEAQGYQVAYDSCSKKTFQPKAGAQEYFYTFQFTWW
ncbi:PREDICTED: BTB/POZ domain-containing protein KCTD14 [Miniopterus natalensis]|uniref:BTB/POZ domain-containing protein KCTD14 n=1 Tax=Miniopterus natalensis TaxID=291302 RepID=UPI0007A72A99|nr:PREDICTED: BTB/POZ domain-containing protein KCTD14 [Miniopterus natalensis]